MLMKSDEITKTSDVEMADIRRIINKLYRNNIIVG